MNIPSLPKNPDWKKLGLALIGVNLILVLAIFGLGHFLYTKGVEVGTLKGTIASLEAESKRKDATLAALATMKVTNQQAMFDFTSKSQ
jgi:hypothetical protein